MIIVANTKILNVFKKIPLFKIDLGQNFIDNKQEKILLKDPFMLKYYNMTNVQILTFGSIGKLIFYQDFTLPNDDFYIFNDDNIYSLKYTIDDSKQKPEDYLASILQEISNGDVIKDNNYDVDKKHDTPNINLPYEQYIQEMIKKRNKKI